MHLRQIYCQGYKAFSRRCQISLRPITVIFGRNNSGKTTLARLPLFAAASLSGPPHMYLLSYRTIRFGSSFVDLASAEQPHPTVTFGLEWDDSRSLGAELQYLASPEGDESVSLSSLRLNGEEFNFELSQKPKPPRETLRRGLSTQHQRHLQRNLGDLQEFLAGAVHIPGSRPPVFPTYETRDAHSWSPDEVPYIVARNKRLLRHVDEWFRQALNGVSLDVDQAAFAFRLMTKNYNRAVPVNLSEAGRGTQSVLPLAVVLLGVARGMRATDLVIVEEPEEHLHPSAHGAVADLVCECASRAQILIETHSENFILRLRRRIAEGRLKTDDLGLYFIDDDQNVREINVDEHGATEDWPAGVFEYDVDEAQAIVEAKLAAMTDGDPRT